MACKLLLAVRSTAPASCRSRLAALQARSGQPRARAIQPLGVIEVPAVDVAEREVREVEVAARPSRRWLFLSRLTPWRKNVSSKPKRWPSAAFRLPV